MRAELTELDVEELLDGSAVDAAMSQAAEGTSLVIINSVCGCAAGNARPAVFLARQLPVQPDRCLTVFAGQDLEATERMRGYLPGIPPSSPFMALLKNGQPVYVLERRHIEGRSANAIALDLKEAFEAYCGKDESAASTPAPEPKEGEQHSSDNNMPPTFRSIL